MPGSANPSAIKKLSARKSGFVWAHLNFSSQIGTKKLPEMECFWGQKPNTCFAKTFDFGFNCEKAREFANDSETPPGTQSQSQRVPANYFRMAN